MGEASHPGPPRQWVRRAVSVPEEVLDDLEAALTQIDSSGTDDELLVRPSSGRNVVPRRSTTEGSQEEVAFGVGGWFHLPCVMWGLQFWRQRLQGPSEVPSHQLHLLSKHLHGPSEFIMDRRRSHPLFRIQEARWELNRGKGTLQSHKVRHQAGLRGWSTSASEFWLKKMARRVLITTIFG